MRADTCHFLRPSRKLTQIVSRFIGTPESEHRVEMTWPIAEPRHLAAGCLHENFAQHLVIFSVFHAIEFDGDLVAVASRANTVAVVALVGVFFQDQYGLPDLADHVLPGDGLLAVPRGPS